MKKKILFLALALALCLGLTVPALASGMPTAEQAQKLVEWKSSLLSNNNLSANALSVPGEIRYTSLNDGTLQTLPSYSAATQNDVYTIKHLGSTDDGSCLSVTGYAYQLDESGVYSSNGINYELHLVKERGLVMWEELLPEEVQLRAGESVSFTLPVKSGYDDTVLNPETTLYQISINICYPQSNKSYIIDHFLKIDPKTVSKVTSASPSVSTTPVSSGFTDVAANSPYAEAVQWAVDQKITAGKTATTFGPGDTCTVSHILTFLYRANGRPYPSTNMSDMDAAENWAIHEDIFPDTVNTNAPCTRSMAVLYMWKAAGSPAPSKTASFADVPSGADYAAAVSWAVEKGITNGTGGNTFSPGGTCTRGQIVTFLYRAMK